MPRNLLAYLRIAVSFLAIGWKAEEKSDSGSLQYRWIVGSLVNPSRWEMNGSDPGVIRQLTEIVIATRQSRSNPAHPCNIHTRPLVPCLSRPIHFFSPSTLPWFSSPGRNQLISTRLIAHLPISLLVCSNSNEDLKPTEPQKYCAHSLHTQGEMCSISEF